MARFSRSTPRVPVGNLQQTIDFYTQTLGFTLGASWPDNQPTFCILDRDDVHIGFFVPDESRKGGTPGGSDSYIDVDNARELHEQLQNLLSIEWGPEVYWYGRREFAIRDPDGYLIIFSEETDDLPTCLEDS